MLRTLPTLLIAASALGAQPSAWTLPPNLAVHQDAPRTWRITSHYRTMDAHGQVLDRQRVSALYTLDRGRVRWSAAEMASAGPGQTDLGPAEPRAFMEGFSYPHAAFVDMMKADFLKGFPAGATLERNLVWDTHMFELFGQVWLSRLRLNEPVRMELPEADLAGTGTFRTPQLELVWTGYSRRRGRTCYVVDYRAFHNPLDMTAPARLKGRSHYWGQIWVARGSRQLEFATLFEDVLGDLTLPGQTRPMIINVFRTATFESLGK